MLNIAQLEADLRGVQTKAKTLLETTMRACADHVVTAATATAPEVRGRLMTDDEKAAIQALLDEGKTIKAKIDRAHDSQALGSEIERLTGGNGTQPQLPPHDGQNGSGPRAVRTLGSQLVSHESYRRFIASGLHRQMGAWTSPAVDLMATTLDTSSGSGGPLIVPDVQPGIQPLPTRRLVVADLIAPGTTDSNVVQYMREKTFTNAATAVAEGGVKPESTLIFEAAQSAVRKIAHWIPVTEEMLEDFAQTQSVVDARLRFGLDMAEEDQLLNGSGVAPNLLGLMALTGMTAAQATATDTAIDAIFKQISKIATLSLIMPEGFVINPANWQGIQLAKDGQGRYLGSGPFAAPQAPMLWGVPGAVTPAIVAGTALVGAFRSMAQIFRKGGVRVEASNSHVDFFVKNLVAIRAEERLALVVYRESAFGKVTGLP